MIRVVDTRFGTIEVEEERALCFAAGLIGFPSERTFALLEPPAGRRVAYLQSLSTPGLAFPVVDVGALVPDYPDPVPAALAQEAGLGVDDVVVLVVVAPSHDRSHLCANLLAPVVVNAVTRKAAQVVLDPRRYTSAFPLRLGTPTDAGDSVAPHTPHAPSLSGLASAPLPPPRCTP